MKADCPFCLRIESRQFDGMTTAPVIRVVNFEPLKPVTPGHRLFVPYARGTIHVAHPASEFLSAAMYAASEFANHHPFDYNLIVSKGPAATQTVEHIHVHYVPRYDWDELPLPWTPQQEGEH